MMTRRRSTLALLALALCVCARAADYQGRAPVVTPAEAASAGVRAPVIPSAALDVSAALNPGLRAATNLPSAAVPGAVNLPAAAPASAASAAGTSASARSAAPASLPAAAVPAAAEAEPLSAAGADERTSVPGDKKGSAAQGRSSVERRLAETQKGVAPQIEAARKDEGDPKAAGEAIQRILSGETVRRDSALAVPSYSGFLPSSVANRLPNPSELFPLARQLAVERAKAWGLSEKSVAFGEVTASLPAGPERELHYSFYAQVEGGKVKPILVSFKADRMLTPATPYSSQVRAWDAAMTLDRKLWPELSTDYLFRRGAEAAPDVALQEARRALPSLGAGVSFTLRFEEVPSTGEVDLWYRFFDNRGSEAAVNARTGERVVIHDAETRKTVDHVLGPKTVDVLAATGVAASVYPLGSLIAAKLGTFPITSFVLAYLAVLALGVAVKLVPLPAFRRWGTVIGMGAIFSPLLAVAFVGLKTLAASLGVAAAAGAVKGAPAVSVPEAYAQAAQAADAAAQRYRLPQPEFLEARRGAEGWVFEFRAGDGALLAQKDWKGGMTAYPYGARERAPLGVNSVPLRLSPAAFSMGSKVSAAQALELAAARLGRKPAQLALSLIVIEKEFSGDKDLWFVGDDEDGRRAAVNARTSEVKDMFTGPARLQIEAAARAAASYKGMPWSQSEWSATLDGYERSLLKSGASQAQLALFRKLTDAAPIKGGRFNPWSGD